MSLQSEDLAHLRSILSQPSVDHFRELLRRLEGLSDEGERQMALEYVQSHLEAWDDGFRTAAIEELWGGCPRGAPDTASFSLVRSLDLGNRFLGDGGARDLSQAPHMAHITRLRLHNTHLGSVGLAFLLRSPYFQGLQGLDLSGNQLGSASGAVLAQASKSLRVLRLDKVGFTAQSIELWMRAAPRLTGLYLNGNELGPQGAQALACHRGFQPLQVLHLNGAGLGAKGAEALALSPHLKRLTHLDLANNHIGPQGAQALARSPHLCSLRSLNLQNNGIGPAGAQALALSPNIQQLTSLALGWNELGDGGVTQLASGQLRRLQRLDLSDNQISLTALKALAKAPHLGALQLLELDGNSLPTGEAYGLLAYSPSLPQLKAVYLGAGLGRSHGGPSSTLTLLR